MFMDKIEVEPLKDSNCTKFAKVNTDILRKT